MKHKALSAALLILLISSLLSYTSIHSPYPDTSFSAENNRTELQTEKPPRDYMKRLSERGTEPLGLKEDKTLNQLLGQPQIKWVIRSEQRHILN